MPESHEWFPARTRPEMLSSDDPPVRPEKPAEILPGPGSPARRAVRPLYRSFVRLGEAVPPLGRAAAVVPALRRRMGLEEPTGKQLVGVWATGAAGAAAVGLVVASVVVGAPAAVTQQFDRLAGLPGIGNEQPAQDKRSTDDTSGAAVPGDRAAAPPGTATGGSATGGSATSDGASAYRYDSYAGGYSGVPGVPGGAILPPGVGSSSTEYTGGTVTRPLPDTTAPAPAGSTSVPAPAGSTTVPPPVTTTSPAPPAETTPPPAETTPPAETSPPPAETTSPPAAETPVPTPATTTADTPAPTPADPTTPPPSP